MVIILDIHRFKHCFMPTLRYFSVRMIPSHLKALYRTKEETSITFTFISCFLHARNIYSKGQGFQQNGPNS